MLENREHKKTSLLFWGNRGICQFISGKQGTGCPWEGLFNNLESPIISGTMKAHAKVYLIMSSDFFHPLFFWGGGGGGNHIVWHNHGAVATITQPI